MSDYTTYSHIEIPYKFIKNLYIVTFTLCEGEKLFGVM